MTRFFIFTSISGCPAGWGYPCLFPVCAWFEWPSSGVVGFNHHEPSWSCSLWLRNCLRLRSVSCRPNPCTWWNSWPPGDWCSWPSTVVAPIGNSDHSSQSAVISMAQAVPNLCVSWKVFLKHQVNWNTVCGAIQDLPWRDIWLADNAVEVLNEHLTLRVWRYVPTNVIRVRNKAYPCYKALTRLILAGMILA